MVGNSANVGGGVTPLVQKAETGFGQLASRMGITNFVSRDGQHPSDLTCGKNVRHVNLLLNIYALQFIFLVMMKTKCCLTTSQVF